MVVSLLYERSGRPIHVQTSWISGFNTQLMGKDLLYWADTLLNLSKKGLESRDILNKHGKNETVFLDHLQKVIENKTTNADHMINKFSKNEDLSELYDK